MGEAGRRADGRDGGRGEEKAKIEQIYREV